MNIETAENLIGWPVRVHPEGGQRHWLEGTILGVNKHHRTATIRPFKCPKDLVVNLNRVSISATQLQKWADARRVPVPSFK